MPMPSPAIAIPETDAIIAQARERAGQMTQAAWAGLSRPLASFGSTAAPVVFQETAQGTGSLADTMATWGRQGSAFASAVSGGDPKMREAYNQRLRELGVPDHVIEGNAWNVQDESAWNFGAVGDKGAAFGANQWYGPRKEALFNFARERGMDPSDPVLQADNWWREMQGPYRAVYEKAVAAGNPVGAALAILHEYEIPAQVHRQRRAADYSSRMGQGYAPALASFGR